MRSGMGVEILSTAHMSFQTAFLTLSFGQSSVSELAKMLHVAFMCMATCSMLLPVAKHARFSNIEITVFFSEKLKE